MGLFAVLLARVRTGFALGLLLGFTLSSYFTHFFKGTLSMGISCPHCQSTNTTTRDIAKKTGGTVGALAGAAGGFAAVMGGMEVGGALGLGAGPIGFVAGSLAGAILGGLFGSATGCAVGSELGQMVDRDILDNHHCKNCDQSFSAPIAVSP
jgi:hypothetical protein